MTDRLTVALDTEDNALEVVGGKGRSLSRLANAGFDVPGGFQVPTSAYTRFVADHGLQARILDLAKPEIIEGTISFEQASANVRQLFDDKELSNEMTVAIGAAYQALGAAYQAPDGNPAVAVRSSANAEDLPDLSFAGQQETYLNVKGAEAVAAAVRKCWASLWTAQAINYRHEMGIEQEAVAMAVIVQIMVPSEVSGILFTANPTNGDRDEMIVNCSFGLGEAVVSGQVTPDTFIVDRDSLRAKEIIVGAKKQMIVTDGEHGTRMEDVAEEQQQISSLSDGALAELASLAIEVETEFDGVPQDIEWAVSDGKLWLLQARPITNLPSPPPKDVTWPEIPGAQLLKRQVAENMPDPLCPLFEDMYLRAIYDTQTWPDGWEWKGRLTKNWMKNFVVTTVNGYAYQPIYFDSAKDWDGYMKKHHKEQKEHAWFANLKRAFSMPEFMIQDMKDGPLRAIYLMMRTFRTLKKFPAIETWEEQQLPDYLEVIERWEKLIPGEATAEELLTGMKSLCQAEAWYWQALRSIIGTAKMTDGGFQAFLEEHAPNEGFISGTFLSGFPSRTLDAEAEMRAIANRIRDDRALFELAVITPAPRLLDALAQLPGGRGVSESIHSYLHNYGRQVFNLDFVEPTLEEQPLPFVMSLKALVRNPGFDLVARRAQVRKMRRAKFWQALRFFKGKQRIEFLRSYWTARINYPPREEALFFMGLAWSTFRPRALELGRRLVETGTFGQPDDVFYVAGDDLAAAIKARADGKALPELKERASEQRDLRALRFRMNQPAAIPPVKDKQFASPYASQRGNDDATNVLRGFAVSPGTVTGIASVIMTPNDFDRMKPDSILVCPLTTPAWTQLFPHATGLVTDIGSILAHGSIVAREYGIPAVLGIGNATQRVKSGQMIAVNGDRGTVTILDE
ncbi:MAG: PEP/pyruvate-binding domain-containing protein [Pseudomonadales bacterium]|jgi:pyruvate,water dikinase|nr:PEP/pyruvate-binding domain-containing protein [Pseudomonadales bacterium]MDP7595470.1 PEP/pyruvate-binding domain-containing protein [Pseudomonadales bacterium]HJN52422.1 PEP/pyruvate-binding domain-containing protein [Pseudomonadales bacterium]|tara:strand:- start:2110 stop:4836 length:2727 start_codon:yes stop_codon:yes gene_type:complete